MLPYAPWLVWAVPLVAAFLHPVLERISHRLRDFIAVFASFLSAVFAASMIPDVLRGYVVVDGVRIEIPADFRVADWIVMPGRSISVGVLVDPLSVFMANVVGWIGFLIMVYSVEFMHGDESITRYWMLMDFFIGSMQLLVMADNLLVMFFGWEGVGFASYALIGYYYKDEEKYWIGPYPPSHCGMKAFVVTRAGDIGLLASIVIIYLTAGTVNFLDLAHDVSWAADLARSGLLTATLLLMFLGPIGKSAQFPLHVWLPEAMAGPTTVSALIHAATMVKAGVYLVARITPILFVVYSRLGELVEPSLHTFFLTVAWIGAFTAFLAASMGMVADQIKKVLAYSTISQLGYMMAAIGGAGLSMHEPHFFVENYMAGIMHLYSHAVFKALLFLAAGSVGHAIGSYMLKDAGGLKKYLPRTYFVMLVGLLALSGVPPFNGFFSKDSILHAMLASGHTWLMALLAVTAVMTVFYSFRLLGLIFFGELKVHHGHGHEHLHDPGPYMMYPLYILAAGSICGVVLMPSLHRLFEPTFHAIGIHHGHGQAGVTLAEMVVSAFASPMIGLTAAIIVAGLYPAYKMYISYEVDYEALVERSPVLRAFWRFLYNRWYINAAYYKVFVDGFLALSEGIFRYIECNGAGPFLQRLYAAFCDAVRRVQTGYLRVNVIYIVAGLLMLVLLTMLA